MEGVIAVFIPIVVVLVTGLVLISSFYFRSKEKQMMLDKGISYEQMIELLKVKSDHLFTLKAGIIIAFFGVGLGLGFLFRGLSYDDEWMAFTIITMIGLGFITAYFVVRKMKNGDEK